MKQHIIHNINNTDKYVIVCNNKTFFYMDYQLYDDTKRFFNDYPKFFINYKPVKDNIKRLTPHFYQKDICKTCLGILLLKDKKIIEYDSYDSVIYFNHVFTLDWNYLVANMRASYRDKCIESEQIPLDPLTTEL